MKKIVLASVFAALIIFLSGCLTTLHPIFTEKDIVYDPGLLGSWKTSNGNKKGIAEITNLASENTIEIPGNISSIKQRGYLVINKDSAGNVSSRYIAFLARVGKHLYFDYYPAELSTGKKLDDFYAGHLIKMHTAYRVDLFKTVHFELSQLDGGFLNKLIEEKKIHIRHEINSDGDIVITASTEELQQYIMKYGDEPGAYLSEKIIFSK